MPERQNLHYRMSVRITAVLLYSTLIIGGLELGLRVALPSPDARELALISEIQNKLNTAEENRTDLPMYLPQQGGECVREDKSKLHWNPRFGFSSKTLDKSCARKLFGAGKVKVVMFGGSTMGNVGTINYLTSLDYYAFGQYEDIVSINLAEPGARLSNMLARFMEEVTDLKPDVALFLDGGNEFSIRQGGPSWRRRALDSRRQKSRRNPSHVLIGPGTEPKPARPDNPYRDRDFSKRETHSDSD